VVIVECVHCLQLGACRPGDRTRRHDRTIAELAVTGCSARPMPVGDWAIDGHAAHDALAPAATLALMRHPGVATMSNSAVTATIRRRRSGWPSIPQDDARGTQQTPHGESTRVEVDRAV
jgi:hypothetical protein